MARKIEQRTRKRKTRKIKNVILFGVEGKNKTEKEYFKNFRTRQGNYNIEFSFGNDTDPIQILNNLIQHAKEFDISNSNGDKIYCVFDSDVDIQKQNTIDKVYELASENGIDVIMSVPSFELWYLLHYKYTTHEFKDTKELIKELRNYIPEYEKNKDVFSEISSNIRVAIDNAKKLSNFHANVRGQAHTIQANPSTDVYKIIEYINEKNQKY